MSQTMIDGGLHPVDTRVGDGRRLGLRPSHPGDEQALTQFYEGLSPADRRLRFLQAMPAVPRRMMQWLVDVDQADHLAWLAFDQAHGEPIVVAEVRCVRLRDEPTVGEVAFAVAESWRKVGLGRLLLETIGAAATSSGIDTITSSVSTDNRGSTALLSNLGTKFRVDSGVLEGRGPVPRWTTAPDLTDQIVARQQQARLIVPTMARAA
jgi:GNAT superfamily N-acetyltransferase